MTSTASRLATALADRYRIERELGQGGMATVYLAEDLKHKRKVALKVLKPELAAVLGAERFVHEITTTASLQHPHILPLFDSGTADGFLFYVMPFIEGETLRDKLNRETQLGVDEAVGIARDVADALEHAHAKGVIHRDIKPENILLANGRPMVADFGIALAVSAAAGGRMTETGLSLGTPHYMSPEQATAEKELTARSDVYSLGSVLYEMLAGQPPHLGGSAQQIIMKIITEQAPALSSLRKSVPPNVVAAVAKSLEKLPADRFATAKAFSDALANPVFTTGTIATVAGAQSRARSRAALAAGLAIGVALGAIVAAALFRGDTRVGERNREQITFHGRVSWPALSPDGKFVAYIENACANGHLAKCTASLVLHEVGGTQPRTVVRDALFLIDPRWTHDGETVVIAGDVTEGRRGLFAISRLTGTPKAIWTGQEGVYDTHPLADSVLIMNSDQRGGRAIIITVASGAIVDSIRLPFANVEGISWSPNGRFIAATEFGVLWIADRSGAFVDSLTLGNERGPVRWTPDGNGLLLFRTGPSREDPFVRIRVSGAGRLTREPEVLLNRVPTLYAGVFDVARRTGRIAISTGDAITDSWSFDLSVTPARARRETSGTTWYGRPDMSRDGARLYYYRGDALGDNIYQLDRATRVEEALTTERTAGANEVRLSADGSHLTFGRQAMPGNVIQQIVFPSRRLVTGPPAEGLIMPLGRAGYITRELGKSLRYQDSIGAAWVSVAIPDVSFVSSFAASPDGKTIAFAGWPKRPAGSSDLPGSRPLLIGTVPVAGGATRIIATLPQEDLVASLTWDEPGELHIARWRNADEHPSAWRLNVASGALTRIADLPVSCEPGSVTIRLRAKAAVCAVRDLRSDVWLFDIAGVTR